MSHATLFFTLQYFLKINTTQPGNSGQLITCDFSGTKMIKKCGTFSKRQYIQCFLSCFYINMVFRASHLFQKYIFLLGINQMQLKKNYLKSVWGSYIIAVYKYFNIFVKYLLCCSYISCIMHVCFLLCFFCFCFFCFSSSGMCSQMWDITPKVKAV